MGGPHFPCYNDWAAGGITAALIFYEHWLLRNGDLKKLDIAFFNMNIYISITIFVFTLIDVLVAG